MNAENYNDTQAIFGKNVKNLRKTRKLTQVDLACEIGIHHTYLSSLERGHRNVSLINIKKIALALHCQLQDLFKGV